MSYILKVPVATGVKFCAKVRVEGRNSKVKIKKYEFVLWPQRPSQQKASAAAEAFTHILINSLFQQFEYSRCINVTHLNDVQTGGKRKPGDLFRK